MYLVSLIWKIEDKMGLIRNNLFIICLSISVLSAVSFSKSSENTMTDFVIVVNAATARCFIRWTLWAIVTSVTVTFAILCFVTGGKLQHLSNHYSVRAAELHPVIIASFFTAAVALLFVGVSFLLTLRLPEMKPYSGYLNTTLVVSLLYMVLITLLCALVMNGFWKKLRDYKSNYDSHYEYRLNYHNYSRTDCYERYSEQSHVYRDWNDKDIHVYTATVVMGYVSAGMYLFYAVASLCIIFWFKKKAKEKDIEEVPLQIVT